MIVTQRQMHRRCVELLHVFLLSEWAKPWVSRIDPSVGACRH
jgi:hypothetical protein